MKSARMLCLLLVFACVAVACSHNPKPKPRPWNLSLKKTTPASIDVDLIGINEIERPSWEGYDLDKYWKPGDLRRANADKLSSTLPTGSTWTVSREDAKWQQWLNRGATELLIIANLPGHFSGPNDPRRIVIPLDKNAWKAHDNTLQIEVQDDLIRVMTPQKQAVR